MAVCSGEGASRGECPTPGTRPTRPASIAAAGSQLSGRLPHSPPPTSDYSVLNLQDATNAVRCLSSARAPHASMTARLPASRNIIWTVRRPALILGLPCHRFLHSHLPPPPEKVTGRNESSHRWTLSQSARWPHKSRQQANKLQLNSTERPAGIEGWWQWS